MISRSERSMRNNKFQENIRDACMCKIQLILVYKCHGGFKNQEKKKKKKQITLKCKLS